MIKFFIDRPIFATVIAILIMVAGLATVTTLPIAQYPNITPPTVNVSAMYPGADAGTVAQTIGVPIESQVNGVDGMLYMNSTSASNGSYSLTVTFKVGTDIDMAAVLVQNRVNAAQGLLPQAVLQQGVTTQKQSTNIVMFISLTSDNSLYNALYLSNYAQINMVDRLGRVPGVGEVSVFGTGDYSMRIWMDPDKMRIRSLQPSDVYNAVYTQNKQISAGGVGVPPTAPDIGYQFTLSVKGRLTSVSEFENIVLKSNPDGSYLRLKDVATIDLGSESYHVSSLENGSPSAAIAIYQLPGSNALDVSKAVSAELEKLKEYLPEDVNCRVVLNTTDFVYASIDEIVKTFIETLVLVVLVILLFLQSFRAMIIPVVVIPISIIGTFAMMKIFGFSINTLTLFGLVLAIAIVVDDAIVVVENATRYMKKGVGDEKQLRREAVAKAMKEIVGPVVGIVLVLLAVFIPTAFIGGITGELYRQFAITIAFATLLSGIVSLVFTPAMCAIFLNQGKEDEQEQPIVQKSGGESELPGTTASLLGENHTPRPPFFLFRWFNKGYGALESWYVKMITKLLRHSALVIIAFVVLMAVTGYLYMKVPTSFIPNEDEGYFMVAVQLPPAASLERTTAVTKRLEKMIIAYPQVKTCMVINGFSMMGGGTQSNGATVFVVLENWSQRRGKGESAFDLVNKVNMEAASIQEATIFAVSPSPIPGLGSSGGLQLELEDINSYGIYQLQDAVDELMAGFRKYPQIMMLQTEYQAGTPQYLLNINRDKIDMMGISLDDVFTGISYYMGSAYVNDYVEFGRIFQVKLQAGAASREFVKDVLKLSVKNSGGDMVPFSSFSNLVEQVGVDNINRYNMYTSASIISMMNPMYSSEEGMSAMSELVSRTLGTNYGYEWTSVAYQQQQAGSSVLIILMLSLLIVLLVL
ncbi:MAG: efflux RND transporter permease subunit, partial [Bacteroidales bacterium]